MLDGIRNTRPVMFPLRVGGFLDMARAPQIIIERVVHLCLVQTKQDMNTWRLDVGIDDADTPSPGREQRGKVGGGIGLTCPTSIRVDGDYARHRFSPMVKRKRNPFAFPANGEKRLSH
jgi:hypothetical protein